MTSPVALERPIIFVGALGHPLSFAWIDLLSTFATVAHVVDTADWGGPDTWPSASGPIAVTPISRLAHTDLGEEALLFGWWGHKILPQLDRVRARVPNARAVLCIDTLPDARSLPGELRAWLQTTRHARSIHGIVCASDAMGRAVRQQYPWWSRLPTVTVPVVFSARLQGRSPSPDAPPRIAFTGRADHLFDHDKGMRKDRLGPLLLSLADAGAEVWLSGLGSEPKPPFRRMPEFTLPQVFAGDYGRHLATYHGTVVAYHEANATIRRRCRNSMSSRLATAALSNSPWLVNPAATPLVRDLEGSAQPWHVDLGGDPASVMETLVQEQARMRSSLDARLDDLSAETYAHELSTLCQAAGAARP